MTTTPAVTATDLTKTYGSGNTRVSALRGVSLTVHRGQFLAIMGPSGSGKSTLLHCLAGLDRASSGQVRIGDAELGGLRDGRLTRLRRDAVGFVFQSFNLLPTLSAAENILLPLRLAGRRPDRDWLDRVIDLLGLADRMHHRPNQLSGGQQQRVACARALITQPAVVFADEPTGNLDSRAGAEVLSLLRASVRELGQTVVMVTHDPKAASYADQVVFLADGVIVDRLTHPTPETVLERVGSLETRAA
ncbi:ABC transporter ATP-binding protein [Cryptosporangium sp. NPDC051539]|uniref:ABC transporter ATP-binding protein n=1 Tax=Cryptosporangium sp. NPDC051539 TaxID=3363962 RepID=UPI00379022E3